MTGDARVTLAREYLDYASKRKVTELPPSLLIRECAELRLQLACVLDVIATGLCLDEDQAATAAMPWTSPPSTAGTGPR